MSTTTLEAFEGQIKSVVTKNKLSSSAVESISRAAVELVGDAAAGGDTALVTVLYRQHKKAPPKHKLTSLYLIDAIARAAKSHHKKHPPPSSSSTTPRDDPPTAASSCASFLKKLESLLPKIVLDVWDNAPVEHREKVRKVLDIWTKAATFSASALARLGNKLLASASTSTTRDDDEATIKKQPASPVAPAMSPVRSTLINLDSSTPESGQGQGGGTGGIPANVLALLQQIPAAATTEPSAAEKEERLKKEEEERMIERVLAEAQGGPQAFPISAPPNPLSNPRPNPTLPVPSTSTSTTSSFHEPAPQQPTQGWQTPTTYPRQPETTASSSNDHYYQQGYNNGSIGASSLSAPGRAALPSYSAGGGGGYATDFGRRDEQRGDEGAAMARNEGKRKWQDENDDGVDHGIAGIDDDATYSSRYRPSSGNDGYDRDQSRTEPSQHVPQQQKQRRRRWDEGGDEPSVRAPLPDQSLSTTLPTTAASGGIRDTSQPEEILSAPLTTSGSGGGGGNAPMTTFSATNPESWTELIDSLRLHHPYFVAQRLRNEWPSTQDVMSLCMPSAVMMFGWPRPDVLENVVVGGSNGASANQGGGGGSFYANNDSFAGGGGNGGGGEYGGYGHGYE